MYSKRGGKQKAFLEQAVKFAPEYPRILNEN